MVGVVDLIAILGDHKFTAVAELFSAIQSTDYSLSDNIYIPHHKGESEKSSSLETISHLLHPEVLSSGYLLPMFKRAYQEDRYKIPLASVLVLSDILLTCSNASIYSELALLLGLFLAGFILLSRFSRQSMHCVKLTSQLINICKYAISHRRHSLDWRFPIWCSR